MTCPGPANMDQCDPKCRCTSGECAGVAFSCGNPCPSGGELNPSTCECDQPFGWIYYKETATGACYQFDFNTSPILCPGSVVTNDGISYYGDYELGEEPPIFAWQTSNAWVVGNETQGVTSLNQSITATLKPGISATSDNTAWNSPLSLVSTSGDGAGCTQQFDNCGAVQADGFVASSTLFFGVLEYPDDYDTYCAGLGSKECFDKACNDYGPCGG